ncbi:PIN domain-containing protein [Fulvimonas yonginensis]|uniref:PIN domain-containing protein n=1 Tax=Fulvimonas yonginensis TaxID=1495200 RepID=A0ABU8JF12_9GAMM
MLDTNVCLDLFVFADPRGAALAAALRRGGVEAVTCPACREEWQAVLHYPQLGLEATVRDRAMAAFDRHLHLYEPPASLPPLPRCTDPDDQKFLALASAVGARWLLSRDGALLRLGRRTLRTAGFAVLTPEQWTLAWNSAP